MFSLNNVKENKCFKKQVVLKIILNIQFKLDIQIE